MLESDADLHATACVHVRMQREARRADCASAFHSHSQSKRVLSVTLVGRCFRGLNSAQLHTHSQVYS